MIYRESLFRSIERGCILTFFLYLANFQITYLVCACLNRMLYCQNIDMYIAVCLVSASFPHISKKSHLYSLIKPILLGIWANLYMFKLIFGTGPRLQILYNKNRVAASSWKKNKSTDLCVFTYYYKKKMIWKYANTWHLRILRRECLNIWRNKNHWRN